jgi:hypothetical protein
VFIDVYRDLWANLGECRMSRLAAVICCVAVGLVSFINYVSAAEFTVDKTDRGVTINLDGKLFTEYLIKSGKKPILWPIIGPTGKPMTRAYPMDETGAKTRDERDHPHHRSLWFSHGAVNGADLWMEQQNSGSTEHQEFVEVSGGKTAKIVTKNDWLDKNGKKLAEDERALTFSTDGDNRVIDFDITIKATAGELKLGDTKEGTFAIRVPDDFRLTAKKGGRIVNSDGTEGKDAWGKPASWVDYEGPIDGETCGIAILNHPSSYGYPTHWHVRDYGLFAANPFGLHDFNGGKGQRGDVTLKDGEAMKLRYRIILHKGDEKDAGIGGAFEKYSAKLSRVFGRVQIDGQPLKHGTVMFIPESGRFATGSLDENGEYELTTFEKGDGAVQGKYRVAINAGEAIGPGKILWHAPKKYSDPDLYGVEMSVGKQDNEIGFNLGWKGGKPFIEAVADK